MSQSHLRFIGKNFVHLTIDSIHKDKTGKYRGYYWAVCTCNLCGNKLFITQLRSIITGRTTSCGCRKDQYIKNTGENSSQFKGYKEIRGRYWNKVQSKAIQKGYSWDLKIEDVWNLYEKQNRKCALSGQYIYFGKSGAKSTASIDRLDNSKGYTIDNIQLVHKHINIMRNTHTVEYFISICQLITEYQNDKLLKR